MELHAIGIDLGKTVFHLVGLNLRGEVVVRKKFSRKQLLHFTANLQVELIGMEACGGAHFLGRALRERPTVITSKPANGSGRPRLDCSTLPTATCASSICEGASVWQKRRSPLLVLNISRSVWHFIACV